MSYHCTEWKHIANGGIFLIIFFAPLSAYFLPAYADALPGMAGWLALIALMPFRKKERINLTLPDVLFLTVTGYCLLNLRGASHWTYLWQLTDCIGLWIWMRQQKNRRYPDILILLLCASGTIQALWGISQTGRLVTSLHSEFAATGSFGNPGPWGGYLAVTLSLACAIMTDRRCPPPKRYGNGCKLCADDVRPASVRIESRRTGSFSFVVPTGNRPMRPVAKNKKKVSARNHPYHIVVCWISAWHPPSLLECPAPYLESQLYIVYPCPASGARVWKFCQRVYARTSRIS